MDRSKPGFPVLHYLLEFSKTQVHCINYATQPSHPLLIQLVHWVWCWNWDTRISFLLWPPCLVILPALAGGLFTTGTTWEAPYMFYLNLIESKSCSVMSDSLQPHGLYSPWNSVGQNTGVGSLSHLQGSSQPRDWTQVSHIAGGFFTSWATREAQEYWSG